MLRLLWTISIILFSTSAYGAIGNVIQHKGNASVERSGEKSELKKGSDIEFKDNVRTGKGGVGITFVDDTNVAVSAHSSLVIDEFVYDPNSKTGSKLVMNIALGTVRYASGNIAKLSNQNVDIRTPTARIGVLGTAFSMTVDEVGKSLIILLPNKDGTVGKISVETGAGQVIMNQAFQSTLVGTGESRPSKPVILDLTLDQINNLLIIKPPKEKIIKILKESKKGKNLLDIDFLEFKELDKNELEEDLFKFNELDINDLDVDLLLNILDQLIKAKSKSGAFDGRISGFNKVTQVNTLVDGNSTRIIRRFGNSTIELDLVNDYGYTINMAQGGIPVQEITTRDEDASNIITIYQSE
jgi:hypothetical protein|tara:strand:- start:343 stop:1407 length:1065 start_codon:yes stop_codon:yes gene_type:complete